MSSPKRDRSVSRGRSRTPQHSQDRSPARSPHSRGADNSRSRSRSRSHSRSPVRPQSAKIVVEKLTKNVTAAHLREVFSAYGVIADLDLPLNQQFLTNRGIAYILYATPLEAEAAVGCMHEAQVDGACVAVSIVLPRRKWADNVPDKRAAADRFGEPGRYRASGGGAPRDGGRAPLPPQDRMFSGRAAHRSSPSYGGRRDSPPRYGGRGGGGGGGYRDRFDDRPAYRPGGGPRNRSPPRRSRSPPPRYARERSPPPGYARDRSARRSRSPSFTPPRRRERSPIPRRRRSYSRGSRSRSRS